jgi:hypothetical protein
MVLAVLVKIISAYELVSRSGQQNDTVFETATFPGRQDSTNFTPKEYSPAHFRRFNRIIAKGFASAAQISLNAPKTSDTVPFSYFHPG